MVEPFINLIALFLERLFNQDEDLAFMAKYASKNKLPGTVNSMRRYILEKSLM